jgi:predicted MFS family arabinose efflux permease
MVSIAAASTSATTGNPLVVLNVGYQQAFFWGGIIAFVGVILALLFIRSPKQGESNGSKVVNIH